MDDRDSQLINSLASILCSIHQVTRSKSFEPLVQVVRHIKNMINESKIT